MLFEEITYPPKLLLFNKGLKQSLHDCTEVNKKDILMFTTRHKT